MKKILTCAIAVIMVAALFVPAFTVPASAADGELLIKVNWLTDNFISVNQGTSVCQDYKEKYDLSKCTDDLFFPSQKEGCPDDVWKSDLFYIEETGYYVTENTKYTIYFEVAAAHNNKYSGVPFLHENTEYDSLIMLAGSFSDDGDVDDPSGNPWTEFCYAYDYAKVDNAIGEGYTGEKDLMYCHPALSVETLEADTCKDPAVTEFKFCTLKIEIDGLNVTTWYLDADKKWVKCDSLGSEVTYQAPFGSEIILGSYTRNEQRHNLIRGLRLVQGTGLTYDQILTAKQTTEPKPDRPVAPETQAPETQAPETKAPETKAPETKAPETQAPETQAPATEAPKEEKKGCGNFAALLPVLAVAATGAVVFRRKRS